MAFRMEEPSSRMFRIRRTVCQMLNDRGYAVKKEDLTQTLEGFKEQFGDHPSREQLTMQVSQREAMENKLYVFFPESQKVGVKEIKVYAERMKEERTHKSIIVVQTNLTPFAKQCILEMCQSSKFTMEHFMETELLVNITHHMFVPTHEILSADEKTQLLVRYKVRDNQLPRIQQNDPVARYFGMQRGQVVRIVRPSETAGRYVTYRFCV